MYKGRNKIKLIQGRSVYIQSQVFTVGSLQAKDCRSFLSKQHISSYFDDKLSEYFWYFSAL